MVWRRPLHVLCIIIIIVYLIILYFTKTSIDANSTNLETDRAQLVSRTQTKVDVRDSDQRKQQKYLNGTTLHKVVFASAQAPDVKGVIERKGVIAKRPGAKATILICHGYMCNKDDTTLFRLIFPYYNIMTFDFRAHGEKVEEHHYCTFGRDEMYDVISAVKVLKSDADLKQIPLIAYGFSMGAVASIQAQSKDSTLFDGMILDCPYDKSENVIKRALNNIKINFFGYSFHIPGRSLLEKYVFHPYVQSFLKSVLRTVTTIDPNATNTRIYPVNPVDSMKKIHIPCLFIHCRNDEKVPIEAVKLVYDGAQGFKRLWITNGRRHFDSFFYNPEKYMYKINKFIELIISNKFADKISAKIKEDIDKEVRI